MKTKKWTCTACGEKYAPSRISECTTCTSYLCPDCNDRHVKKECDYLKALLANCSPKWKDQDQPVEIA